MQLSKRKLCKRNFLSGSTVPTFLNCTYLKSQSIFDGCFLGVMGMLYLLCCAVNMYSVNPGGQKAQGKPRLAGGEFRLPSEMPLCRPPRQPLLDCQCQERFEEGEDSTVVVVKRCCKKHRWNIIMRGSCSMVAVF